MGRNEDADAMWFLTRSIARSMCTGAVNGHVETRSSWAAHSSCSYGQLSVRDIVFIGSCCKSRSCFSWKHKCGTYSHPLDDIRRRHIWLLLLLPQQQRPSSNLSVKRYFSSSHSSPSPGSGGGSLPAASSQFDQLPSLTSSPSTAAAASTFASKDCSKYTAFSHTRFL
jgi:hypothetical protein